MPIKPENEKLYPGGSIRSPEWLAIRARILERAGHRCEGCYVPNHAIVWRDTIGIWHLVNLTRPLLGAPSIKIVITIAHVDHDPTNNGGNNLRAWCQQCHNRHDQAHRQTNARRTRHSRRAGGDFFERG